MITGLPMLLSWNGTKIDTDYLDQYDEPKDFEYIIIKTTEEQKNYLIENGNAKNSEAEALYQATRKRGSSILRRCW